MIKSIVISGPPAVGKTTLAKGLAKEFGLTYLSGGDALKEIAKEQGFNSEGEDWWDTEEGMQFLKQREENDAFDKKVDQKLIELFSKGGMVITSYTLPWLVDDGIKIWLEGSHSKSTERMQNRDNMSKEEAHTITKRRYDKNKSLYRKLYDFDFGRDVSVFDLIIDTNHLDANQVMEEARKIVKQLQ